MHITTREASLSSTRGRWDRIIGFDSLELLPILACSIFVYRARWLLQASEPAHVQRLLADSAGIRVVPLLQLFLADHNALVVLPQGAAEA